MTKAQTKTEAVHEALWHELERVTQNLNAVARRTGSVVVALP